MGPWIAAWRVSLRRTRADWPLVLAAWLVTLLAAVLLAAGPIYATAASEAGLRRALEDAPLADRNVQVSLYAAVPEARAIAGVVEDELRPLVDPLGGVVVQEWRGSQTLALPDIPGAAAGDQAVVGALDEPAAHATLVSGTWPNDRTAGDGDFEVVVLDTLAATLGLQPGDELTLVAPPTADRRDVPLRVVGIIAIDADDAYWYADDQLVDGRTDNGRYQTFGPFLATETGLLEIAGNATIRMRWASLADYASLSVDDATTLQSGLVGLSERLSVLAGTAVQVTSALGPLLDEAQRSLLVSKTGVLLLMAQLGILAAYAIVLTASLLVEHRRIDTALLRSRGARARDVFVLALLEAILVAGPSVVLAPWLATVALGLLNVAGPLADVGLRIEPRVSGDAYLAAGVAGIVAVALLAVPAALAARAFAVEQSGVSRQQTRTFGQRLGIDLALLAITGIALWQLRLYGAPLTSTVEGRLGIDPLLVAAPAIGLLTGGVVALRVLPLVAAAFEAAISRGAGLVASLGSRQLARRPLRYTRTGLLLMLAVSMGVFGLSYGATWSGSQRDQSSYQVGADVRVVPATPGTAGSAWADGDALRRLPGVELASPVERLTKGISFAASASTDVLALDADTAASAVAFRSDGAAVPLGGLLQGLREGRPALDLPTLPYGATSLRVAPLLVLSSPPEFVDGPSTDAGSPLGWVPDIRIQASALLVDGQGLVVRTESEQLPMDQAIEGLVLPLIPAGDSGGGATGAEGGRAAGPLRLAELGLEIWSSGFSWVTGSVGITAAWVAPDPSGPWTTVALDASGPWHARMAQGRRVLVDLPDSRVSGMTVELRGDGQTGFLGGERPGLPAGRISVEPGSLADWSAPVPALVNRAFASASATEPGDLIAGTVEGARRQFRIEGIVERFPTTDPERPLLILDQPTLGLLRLQGSSTAGPVSEWWLSTADGQAQAVAAAVRASPLGAGGDVVSITGRVRTLSNDVVALGMIGALAIGSLVTGLFAVVGLVVSTAVSARQRRVEFALLRALGLSDRQLSGSLWLENASLVLVSLVTGTGLGLLIGWLVLPFVTVTQRGTAPIPPVALDVPWDEIALLNVVSAGALAIAIVAISRGMRRLGMGSILRMGEDQG